MTPLDVLAAAQRLQQQDQPFALVSVLRVQAPASAKPGDKAVVTADGIVQGWIGGGCAQPAVLRTVRQALADGAVARDPHRAGRRRSACANSTTCSSSAWPATAAARWSSSSTRCCRARGWWWSATRRWRRRWPAWRRASGLPVTVVAHGADAARFPDAER